MKENESASYHAQNASRSYKTIAFQSARIADLSPKVFLLIVSAAVVSTIKVHQYETLVHVALPAHGPSPADIKGTAASICLSILDSAIALLFFHLLDFLLHCIVDTLLQFRAIAKLEESLHEDKEGRQNKGLQQII